MELRLIVQLSAKIDSLEQGQTLYKAIKSYIKECDETATINGQIIQNQEPCCKERNGYGRA